MKQLKSSKAPPEGALIDIQHIADTWEVSAKTVQNWVNVVYLAFDIPLPKAGPYPVWAVQLIEICAKHISQKATLYFAETREQRRLKGVEFVRKIRFLRKEGHFQEFEQFRQEADLAEEIGELYEDELETLAELGTIAYRQDQQMAEAQAMFEAREDEQIDKLATFIATTDQRRMGKLQQRLQRRLGGTIEAELLEGQ